MPVEIAGARDRTRVRTIARVAFQRITARVCSVTPCALLLSPFPSTTPTPVQLGTPHPTTHPCQPRLKHVQIKEKMIVIFEGDHFDLENIGELDHMIDAVWDRGVCAPLLLFHARNRNCLLAQTCLRRVISHRGLCC